MSKKDNFTFGLKNFRNYDAEGATFKVSPITILTGENSAGKSSMVKGMMMLGDMLKKVEGDTKNLGMAYLDFAATNNKYGLGRYSKVINKNAGPNGEIELSYKYHSVLATQDLTVKYHFVANPDDDFDNGHLVRITLLDANDQVVWSCGKREDNDGFSEIESHYRLIKDSFLRYAYLGMIVGMQDDYCFGYNPVDDELIVGYDWLGSPKESDFEEKRDNFRQKCVHEFSDLGDWDDLFEDAQTLCSNDKMYYPEKKVGSLIESRDLLFDFKRKGYVMWNPVLEDVQGYDSEQLRDYFSVRYAEELKKYPNLQLVLDYIVGEFENSDFCTFGEFYFSMEDVEMDFNVYCGDEKGLEGMLLKLRLGGFSTMISYDSKIDKLITGISRPKLMSRLLDNLEGKGRNRFILNALLQLEEKHSAFFATSGYYDTVPVDYDPERPSIQRFLQDYMKLLVSEAIAPEMLKNTKYIGSNCVQAQRLYTLDKQGDDMVDLLSKYRSAKQSFLHKYGYKSWLGEVYKPNVFTKKWLKEFGVGDNLLVEATEDGLGIALKLEKDGERVLLADEGYGITQLVYVILQIEACILSSKWGRYSIEDGPVDSEGNPTERDIVECDGMLLAIEEPENHLHPALQSKLADMFLDAYENYNIRFIVETHSEYLIRESQVLVSQMGFETSKDSDSKAPFRTYYIPKDGKPYSLGYRKDGRFAEKFGDGFYNESTILTNKML